MTQSDGIDVHRVVAGALSSSRDLVQTRADDVVLAAARFKPNAVGSHELTMGTGFGQRQLLKARGAYLGERVVIGVTPLHVYLLALLFGGRASSLVARLPRDELRAELVGALGNAADALWPAVLLADRSRRCLAELQPLEHDDEAWQVLALLLRVPVVSDPAR
jgi:hypothetical protein